MNRRNFIKLLSTTSTALLTNINVVLGDTDKDWLESFDMSKPHTIEEWKRFFKFVLNSDEDFTNIHSKTTHTRLNNKLEYNTKRVFYNHRSVDVQKQLDNIPDNHPSGVVFFLSRELHSQPEIDNIVKDSIPALHIHLEKHAILIKR